MSAPSILVVGSMNMDLMMYGISRLPKYGVSVKGSSYAFLPGGKASNQAVAAARLGAAATLVGRVGADDNGHVLVNALQQTGVNTDYVVVDDEAQTGLAPIMVNRHGQYVSYGVRGATDHLGEADVRQALDARAFDFVLMQLEMPIETVFRTYELAAQKNIPVFLDAGPAMRISLERLKGIAIISPNEAETEALTGIPTDTEANLIRAAKHLYAMSTPRYVVLKVGARGALIFDGSTASMIPAFKVNAVDSTAAGDTFSAALVTQLCQGKGIAEATLYANAAAALCVTIKGTINSIPDGQQVQDFLRNYL
ncbi:MAG: ribokinase [Chloroflexota bacterium]|nr:ribokinase [Chloroflexota bacterium]